MDELYGGKVTIPIQRDHREAWIRKILAVPSTTHGMLKFPVFKGMVTLQSSKIIPLKCTMVSGSEAQPSAITRSAKERIKVTIHLEYPEQAIAIGSTLTEEGQKELCGLLRCNLDIFAWKPADMTGVSRRSNKRSFDDGKGRKANASLFCQPYFARSRNKLHTNGKVGTGFGKYQQRAKKIFPGTSDHCHHGPASQADIIKTESRRKATEVEHRTGRRPEDDSLATPMEVEEKLADPCTLFTDGSSCIDGSGAGLILINPEVMEFTYALRFRFDATNNEAKSLKKKSMNKAEVLAVVMEEGSTWITPIYEYLTEETLLAEKKKARAIKRRPTTSKLCVEGNP
ncbi:hypothetical protein Tco_1242808 [Tanacetum coccineum]